MNERTESDKNAKQQSEGVGIIPPLARAPVPVCVTTVPTNRVCGTRSLAAALPSSQPPAQPRDRGAAHPGTFPWGRTGHIHPQPLSSHRKGARINKTPGVTLACCHRPSHPIFPSSFVLPGNPFPLSSCIWAAKLLCHPELCYHRAIAKPTETKGEGGAEYGAAALANVLLSSGTEQTVAGYGANLLQEQIFNIPPLQESLEAAREPQAERREENNSSPRSALLRNPATGQK